MLTADAFGVLPPIARLTPDGAMYHFLSGYTAKVAGTEKGVTEPKPIFSTCFGAPFLPLAPGCYARMLGEKIAKHQSRVWLVNTGWTGGPYGIGKRMKIAYTRAMINAALSGALDARRLPAGRRLQSRRARRRARTCRPTCSTRAAPGPNPADYDAQAAKLAKMFVENFKAFEGDVSAAVKAAGPRRLSPVESGIAAPGARQSDARPVRRPIPMPHPRCPHTKPSSVSRFTRSCCTASKIFCGCSAAFGGEPNTHICPVCLGLPGALPVLNRAAVDYAIRAALALGCTIQPTLDLRAEELLLSGSPQGLPDLAVRAAAGDRRRAWRPAATTGRPATTSGSSGSTWKRTPASCCTRASRIRRDAAMSI